MRANYEPIQAKSFKTIEDYNEYLKSNEGLIYVHTLVFGDEIVLLYTIAKEEK